MKLKSSVLRNVFFKHRLKADFESFKNDCRRTDENGV